MSDQRGLTRTWCCLCFSVLCPSSLTVFGRTQNLDSSTLKTSGPTVFLLVSEHMFWGSQRGILPWETSEMVQALSYIPFLRTFLLRCYDLIIFSNSLYMSPLSHFPILITDRIIFFSYQDENQSCFTSSCTLPLCPSVSLYIFQTAPVSVSLFAVLAHLTCCPNLFKSSKLFSQLPGSPLFWFIPHIAGKLLSLKYNFRLSLHCLKIYCGLRLPSEEPKNFRQNYNAIYDATSLNLVNYMLYSYSLKWFLSSKAISFIILKCFNSARCWGYNTEYERHSPWPHHLGSREARTQVKQVACWEVQYTIG